MRVLHGLPEAREAFEKRRGASYPPEIVEQVERSLRAVREGGDRALKELTERIYGVKLRALRVPEKEMRGALEAVPEALQEAMRTASARIRSYYEHQPKEGFLHPCDGALLGQIVKPLRRVGCYVPGGQAPLFSSLLMTAVPAQVAGVREIVVATPPRRDGTAAPEILAAAHLLGLETVYLLGGSLAIAAFAYGTASVPRVDKICGPGSLHTVLAKKLVFGEVGIESLPGPTETLVLADEVADVGFVIADLLAQAEHDGAQPVLVTTSRALAEAVVRGLEPALSSLPTREAAQASVQRGFVVLVGDLEEGIEVANLYAPEHLCLLVRDPWALVERVENAGGLFMGEHSMEALGDYIAGPSHVMPTGGTARFSSFVNVRDFQKVIPLVQINPPLLQKLGPAAARMARAEGLEAHARAIEARLEPSHD